MGPAMIQYGPAGEDRSTVQIIFAWYGSALSNCYPQVIVITCIGLVSLFVVGKDFLAVKANVALDGRQTDGGVDGDAQASHHSDAISFPADVDSLDVPVALHGAFPSGSYVRIRRPCDLLCVGDCTVWYRRNWRRARGSAR